MFAGSPLGAEGAAILYSLTETCRRIGAHPFAYLSDVLRTLAATEHHTAELFQRLTPVRWIADHAE